MITLLCSSPAVQSRSLRLGVPGGMDVLQGALPRAARARTANPAGESAASPAQGMPPRAAFCTGVQAGMLLTLEGKCTAAIRDGAQRALPEALCSQPRGKQNQLLPEGQDPSEPPHSQEHPGCARLVSSSSSWKWDSIPKQEHFPSQGAWLLLKETTGCRSLVLGAEG